MPCCHRPLLRVISVEDGRKLTRRVHAELRVSDDLGQLIPRTPHHDARMVSVAPHEIDYLPLVPFVPQSSHAILHFGHAPFVERLVHHHEAHFVTQVEKPGRGKVVRCADCVTTHLLQERELTPRRLLLELRAEHAEIVMKAYAAHLPVLPVQEEPLRHIEAQGADAVAELFAAKFN